PRSSVGGIAPSRLRNGSCPVAPSVVRRAPIASGSPVGHEDMAVIVVGFSNRAGPPAVPRGAPLPAPGTEDNSIAHVSAFQTIHQDGHGCPLCPVSWP